MFFFLFCEGVERGEDEIQNGRVATVAPPNGGSVAPLMGYKSRIGEAAWFSSVRDRSGRRVAPRAATPRNRAHSPRTTNVHSYSRLVKTWRPATTSRCISTRSFRTASIRSPTSIPVSVVSHEAILVLDKESSEYPVLCVRRVKKNRERRSPLVCLVCLLRKHRALNPASVVSRWPAPVSDKSSQRRLGYILVWCFGRSVLTTMSTIRAEQFSLN